MEILFKLIASILVMIGGDFISFNGIQVPLVTQGEGLYDGENGFYVYKGRNPDNYIYFNNKLWRIMSIDKNTIQIIKNDSIGDMAFDMNDSNDWDISSLKRYLRSYYSDVFSEYHEILNGDVEIMNVDDYLMANSNEKLCGSLDLYFKNDRQCFKSNYINNLISSQNDAVWTLTQDKDTLFYVGNTYFNDIKPSVSTFGVLPVLYLDGKIRLYGEGTLQNPYKIQF
ncbi:MAG: hypothetical protein HFH47_02660 [Bacilli bacterium]|nr:hypothetical protein [Bacilli bacterium]